jgi:hypothetical protein
MLGRRARTLAAGFVFAGIAFAAEAPVPGPSRKAPVKVSTDRHPYLFFALEDLPAIRERSKQPPASEFRHFLQRTCVKQVDSANPEKLSGPGRVPTYQDRELSELMIFLAFEGLLSGDRKCTDAAKKLLLGFSGWKTLGSPAFSMSQGGVLREAAIAYDFLYNDLTEDERKKAEAFLAMGAAFLYEGGQAGDKHWSGRNQRLGNWRPQMYSGIGLTGMALWTTHPEAKKWTQAASEIMKDVLDYDFDPDGGAYEAYVRYFLGVTCHALLPTLEALRRVTGEDLFTRNNSVLYRATPFTACMLFPTRDGVPAIGDTDDGLYPVGISLIKAAAEFDDGLAAWYLNAILQEGPKVYWGDNEGIWGTLWARPVPPENPETSKRLSLAKAYDANLDEKVKFGTGHVFLRTGFTRKDDLQFVCQAGEAGGFHGHADKGGYILNAYEVKFLRDFFTGGYEGSPFFRWHHSGEAHQTVLIDGEGQGAQEIGLRDADYHTQVARVETLESGAGYDYVRMDTRKAYEHNPKNRPLRKAKRHVVFMRGPERTGYFVVLDDIQKDDRPHEYSHPFHYHPMVKVESAEGGRIVLSHAKASLHIVAVHPREFKASRHTTDGDSYVKLTCQTPLSRLVMLTVLYPVKGSAAPPEIVPVKEGERIGTRIGAAEIVFDLASGQVRVNGKAVGQAAPR